MNRYVLYTTVTLFLCSECGKSFSRDCRLQKHREEKHFIAISKRKKHFNAPLCQQVNSFFTLLQMQQHCEEEHKNDLGTQIPHVWKFEEFGVLKVFQNFHLYGKRNA